jgi:hypothetical protein
MCTRPAIERAGNGNPPPTAGRARFLSQSSSLGVAGAEAQSGSRCGLGQRGPSLITPPKYHTIAVKVVTNSIDPTFGRPPPVAMVDRRWVFLIDPYPPTLNASVDRFRTHRSVMKRALTQPIFHSGRPLQQGCRSGCLGWSEQSGPVRPYATRGYLGTLFLGRCFPPCAKVCWFGLCFIHHVSSLC